ncbi:hypothetical protein TNCV_133111, partial [Trichonephila clavipes]
MASKTKRLETVCVRGGEMGIEQRLVSESGG